MNHRLGAQEEALKCLMIVLLGSLLSMMTIGNLWAWPIPDTGQTKCYNDTVEITCPVPGGPFYGQDGNYTINPHSYTKLDAAGAALSDSAATWVMVKDNVTGLIWENKTDDSGIHDKDNTYTWCDKNPATNGGDQGTCGGGSTPTDTEAFIKALNDAHFGGFSDWRMPVIKELFSIVNSSVPFPGPTIDTSWFPYTPVSSDSDYWLSYWSSTTNTTNDSNAWVVQLGNGGIMSGPKSGSNYVRAVRAGQSGSLDHFVNNGDGTVTDTATGLMWQQGTSSSTLTWEAALTYAEGLPLAGYDDWRMPTPKELLSIVDYSRSNPAIDTTLFPGTVSDWHWLSTTYAGLTTGAWRVDFCFGYVLGADKLISYKVRAVRAGQSRLSGHLIITAPGQADRWRIGEQKTITWNTAEIAGNVKISLSRQGGKAGTFSTITESTGNDGSFDWTVTGPDSVNCVLKIEPLNDLSKATSQGLFSISLGIQITPSSLNFRYVKPGEYKDLTLEVKNIGTGTLTGTVSTSPPFSIVSGGSYNLSANQTQQVVVRYTAPLEEGVQTGSLTFTGGGGITVQVKGTNQSGLPWLHLLLGN